MKTALLSLTLAIAFAPTTTNAQATFRGEASHAGTYRDAGPRQFHNVKWKFPTGDKIVSSPVYADGAIYFGGDDGNVYAVDAANGHQLWKWRTGGPVAATPAIAGATLYVGSYDGKFYALDTRTGAPRWKFTTGGERRFEAKGLHGMQPKNQTIADPFDVYLSSPVVGGGLRQQGNAYVFSSPSVAGDLVYVGVLNGTLEARDLDSGALVWEFQTDASKRNAGWVLTADRKFNSQMLFWSNWREAPIVAAMQQFGIGAIFSSPLVVGGTVYFGSTDGNMYALE